MKAADRLDILLRQERRRHIKSAIGIALYAAAILPTLYGLMWLAERYWPFAIVLAVMLALGMPAAKAWIMLIRKDNRDEARQQASKRGRQAAVRREREIAETGK